MSDIKKAALAIDAGTYKALAEGGFGDYLRQRLVRVSKMPGNEYYILSWNWEPIGPQFRDMMSFISRRRYAYIDVSNSENIIVDIKTTDELGCDEKFKEVFGVGAEVRLWGNRNDVLI